MREILFRGKRTDTGEWVEGYFCKNRIADTCYIAQSEGGDCCNEYFRDYEVIPETVGQYTGLTDRNGTKIFEGDILNMHGGCDAMDISEYDIRCKVVYGRKGYGAEIGFSGAYNGGMQIPLMLEGALTVIGNIHDNPELLKDT